MGGRDVGHRDRVRHRRGREGGHRLEITTFRADSYDQVSRNPEVRFGDRLEDDLVRRDFTVNAMAVRITPEGPGVPRPAQRSGRRAQPDPGHSGRAGGVLR